MSSRLFAFWKLLLGRIGPLFRLDYSLAQAYIRYVGAFGAASYLAFHFLEATMGYRDWWPLRLACCLVPLPLLFFPRRRPLKTSEII